MSWILLPLGQAVCFTSLSQTFTLTYSSFATALLTLSQNPPLGLSAVHNSPLHFKLLSQFFISPNYSRRRRSLTFVRSVLPKSAESHNRVLIRPTYNLKAITKIIAFKLSVGGFEPPSFWHMNLNHACLPISPYRHKFLVKYSGKKNISMPEVRVQYLTNKCSRYQILILKNIPCTSKKYFYGFFYI